MWLPLVGHGILASIFKYPYLEFCYHFLNYLWYSYYIVVEQNILYLFLHNNYQMFSMRQQKTFIVLSNVVQSFKINIYLTKEWPWKCVNFAVFIHLLFNKFEFVIALNSFEQQSIKEHCENQWFKDIFTFCLNFEPQQSCRHILFEKFWGSLFNFYQEAFLYFTKAWILVSCISQIWHDFIHFLNLVYYSR